MPGSNRIRRLPDLLPGDLSQAKPDTLSREFDALAQDPACAEQGRGGALAMVEPE